MGVFSCFQKPHRSRWTKASDESPSDDDIRAGWDEWRRIQEQKEVASKYHAPKGKPGKMAKEEKGEKKGCKY